MSNLYVIKGMGRGFDGLVVEAKSLVEDDPTLLFMVTRIINRNSVFGDRNVSFPVPEKCLYIDGSCLEQVDEAPREYDSTNPYGEFKLEGRYTKDSLEVVFAQYSKALTVTVYEKTPTKKDEQEAKRTLYSQTFIGNFAAVKEAIEVHTSTGDVDDLIFRLNELKEMEANV